MNILVQKFGGTSVATLDRLKVITQKVAAAKQQGYAIVVVVSAMGDETDHLVSMAEALQASPDPREYDLLVSTGEQKAMSLLAMALKAAGMEALSFTGQQAGIQTSAEHINAKIMHIDTAPILQQLHLGKVVVVAGFQGGDGQGEITTLGRGGSDLTAVALAAALSAKECQIFTDVKGVHTADPRLVPNAVPLPRICFEEMLEFSSQGARVLHRRAVLLAGKLQVPLRVLSSFEEGEGTLVDAKQEQKKTTVTGIAYECNDVLLSIKNGSHALCDAQLLASLARQDILPSMVTQNRSLDNSDIALVVNRDQRYRAATVIREWAGNQPGVTLDERNHLAHVSLIGTGVQSCKETNELLFSALSEASIPVHMTISSEFKISLLINEDQCEECVKILHEAFHL